MRTRWSCKISSYLVLLLSLDGQNPTYSANSFRLELPTTVLPSQKRRLLAPTTRHNAESTDDNELDWRDFRARLVLQEKQQKQKENGKDSSDESAEDPDTSFLSDSSDSWAYEAGTTIEKGSVILSRSEQDFGYGIRQQYFHKCVILVLHHDKKFTKGVVLNRPTDLLLSDEDFVCEDGTPMREAINTTSVSTKKGRWKVWFGGEVRGIHSEQPEITCLHSISSPEADRVSETILKNIQWTTLAGAIKLVRENNCQPSDFNVVCGYAGWAPGQLLDELERKSWFMAATDSKTILKELQEEKSQDPRDAGLEAYDENSQG